MATKQGRPGWILIGTFVVLAVLVGAMALAKTWTPRLGLDLRGGTTITLTAANTTGQGAVSKDSLEQARTIIQQRVDSLGVGETEVTTSGDSQIIVTVPNVQRDELVDLVGQTARLSFRAVYAMESADPAAQQGQPGQSADPSQGSGQQQPQGEQPQGEQPQQQPQDGQPTANRPAPMLPTAPPMPRPTQEGQGIAPDKAMEWQPSAADTKEFAKFTCADDFPEVADQPLFACDEEGTTKFLLGPTLIDGDKLEDASAGVPQGELQWKVSLKFNPEGAKAFEEATRALSTKQQPMNQFAIVLDGKSISAPSVDNPIPGGSAEISGNFNQDSATKLANVLKYGALPLAFDISSVENVSATLGGEQLQAGLIAGAIGLLLVLIFSIVYYRGLSLVVIASLIVAAAFSWCVMVLLGSAVGMALNLPGIAGAIVAIGVTADSFIIYFERIRDEVREGRSLRSAVESGWSKAKRTVLVADAVSLLSAVVLFVLAIGAVRGFAFMLGLTTLIDIAITFWFTKPLMSLLVKTKFFGQGHKWSGLDAEHFGVKSIAGRTRARTRAASTGSEA